MRAPLAGAMLVALGACAPGAAVRAGRDAAAPSSRPYVVVVSLDAFRHDFLARYRPPAIERLAARGLAARALIPPFPSKTFPSHYTIATGLYPGHHGVVTNNFFDPEFDAWFRAKDSTTVRDGRWYGGVPIWVAAEREGVRASVYFWPGSEGAVQGHRPSAYWHYRASTPDSARVDASLAQLRLPPERRPHLVMLYLSVIDDTTHRYGPETPRTAAAVATADRAVGRLLDGIDALPMRDSVNVIVLSDHGMQQTSPQRMVPIRPILAAAGVDTAAVHMGDNGPTLSLWFDGDTTLARRTRAALRAGLSHARVYAPGETPRAWHLDGNVRAGDLLVVAEPGYVVAKGAADRVPDGGNHGWDPAEPAMHGVFIAAGPQIARAGVIPAFENVHVYPFLAALLRLQRAPRGDADASVLAPYLRSRR